MEPKGQDKPRFTLPKNINLAVLQEPRNLAITAFVAGLLVGLVLLGWWLFPVSWENASPAELSPAARADYLRAAIDSYTLAPNNSLAPAPTPTTGGEGSLFSTGSLLTTLCGITLIIGLVLGVLYIVRSRQGDELGQGKLKGGLPIRPAVPP